MKNLSLSFSRFALLAVTAISLGACGRAEYAPLSRATTQPASTPVAQAAPYAPVASEASATVTATAPVAPVAAAPVAVAPASATTEVAETVAPTAPAVAAAPQAKAATAPKPNLVQRLALRKITKKLDKLASQAPQLKQRDASAARGGLDSNLRSAILFGLVGLIVLLFAGVSPVFGVVGTILLIVGLVFLVLWLLDQA
jgi:F0F1-type ATP synthase assembly protein I